MLSLNLNHKLSFEHSFRMFITKVYLKINAFSPWNLCLDFFFSLSAVNQVAQLYTTNILPSAMFNVNTKKFQDCTLNAKDVLLYSIYLKMVL